MYIIYGYHDLDTLLKLLKLQDVDNKATPVFIIEPRKLQIDKLRSEFNKNGISIGNKYKLITKALSQNDKMVETIMSYDPDEDCYFINTENDKHPDITKRERVYTTSLSNIVRDNEIQNISHLVFNINVGNVNEILNSIKPFNHLVSKILFKSNVDRSIYETNKLLDLSFKRQTKISKPELQDWVEYSHKNLNLELPKICMFFTEVGSSGSERLLQFIKRYKIDIIYNKEIIPYQQISLPLPDFKIDKSVLFTKNLLNNLHIVFNSSDKKYDIILAFNENTLTNNPNFYILYPPKDDTLYIDRQFDIIYSSKNSMYTLYELLQSEYFNDWIHEQAKLKPTLVKFFIKRWFYEYISKTFTISSTSL